MKLGFIPAMLTDRTVDGAWVAEQVRTLEDCGVESVWGVEHVVMAESYEPLYPYSADGRAPIAADTCIPDPLEWLSFHSDRKPSTLRTTTFHDT